jgi:hypothetical protein
MDILLGLSPTYQECPSERVNPTRHRKAHGLLRLPESLVQELANERAKRELASLSKLLAIRKPPPNGVLSG